ncbi:MAG: membrane protein insertion efficiency factor YidD [Mariprofundaceae bacterium]|nr:membrane protein insertion efficiency factor YidD [Mariprofundaceae bacterium]
MAGLRLTWAAMVMLKLACLWYVGLMLSSILLLGLWQQLRLPVSSPQSLAIHFYQHVLGKVDGRSCPSYPVCSVYARQAIQKHGWLVGSWLAMDRLIHESDDLKTDHWVIFEGEQRLYDPLNRNDFWLKGVE